MQPVQMTRAEYAAKYGAAPTLPAPVSASAVQQTPSPTPSAAPVKMTRAEYAAKYGVAPTLPAPVSASATEDQGSILGSMAKGLVSAPLTMAARPIQAAAEGLFGKSSEDVDAATKKIPLIGGLIAPVPQNTSDVVKDVGRGVQTTALGLTAPETVLSAGAGFGFGNALEQNGSEALTTPGGAANTLFQTGLGAAGAKTLDVLGKPVINYAASKLGGLVPDVVSKASNAIEKYMADTQFLRGAAKPLTDKITAGATFLDSGVNKGVSGAKNALVKGFQSQYPAANPENMMAKAEEQLQNKYTELFSDQSTPKQKKFLSAQKTTELKNSAGTQGTPPQETLAKAHVVPEQNGAKLTTLEQANKFRATARPLQEANRAALAEVQTKTPQINLADQEEKAVTLVKTPRNINEGTATGLEKEVRAEYAALRAHYGEQVPITILDDIKSARWKPIAFDKADATRPLLGDANYAIAKTAQKTIEETARTAGAEDVAQLNRHIGDIMEGAKFLEGLNGKSVKGAGFSKLGIKAAGFMLGNSVPAKIAGYLGGDFVANMMISNEISGPVQRLILKNIESKEGPEALQATVKYLIEQKAVKSTQLALPAPATAEQMIKRGGVNVLPSGHDPIPASFPYRDITPGRRISNDIQQNSRRLFNTPQLPAPSERIITPNTQGTPNRLSTLYGPGGDAGDVGGMRQRIRPQK